jgi:quercetin dioxygenase-like cupin family protein
MTSAEGWGSQPAQSDSSSKAIVRITAAAADLLEQARSAPAGRAGLTLTPGAGAPLKQTLLAMREGVRLGEHESPGAATLQVLRGRVRLVAGARSWELAADEYIAIPDQRHHLESLQECVVLLTVAADRSQQAG